MSGNIQLLRGSFLAALLIAPVAMAHHSFAMFDGSKNLTLTGTVREFQWTNPHTWLQLSVRDEQGNIVEWSIEGASPSILTRSGLGWSRNMMRPGDKVTVIINPTRDGSKAGALNSITLPDGRTLGQKYGLIAKPAP